ncbi:MAG: hemolysin III family protein [Acidobacteria bacterium]|nr:MAG: hemolysin III family protein [Acidobacteriota bacterium]
MALTALVVLVVQAALRGTAWHVIGSAVFGSSLVILYTASTLYHSIGHARAQRFLQGFDHTAIYLLIAGTYTPFALVTLRGPWGWTLLGIVWGAAAIGIGLRAAVGRRMHVVQVALYLLMGWVGIVAFRALVSALGPSGVILVLAGGFAYTAGIAFYASRRVPYAHAIWHLFVMAGSTCHFWAVFSYVLP